MLPVIVSITSFASLAKLMGRFEMTQAIAIKIVEQLSSVPALYSLCMPIVATLGSGLTGSTTTSNFLFGRLQVNTAKELGLNPVHSSNQTDAGVAWAQVVGS